MKALVARAIPAGGAGLVASAVVIDEGKTAVIEFAVRLVAMVLPPFQKFQALLERGIVRFAACGSKGAQRKHSRRQVGFRRWRQRAGHGFPWHVNRIPPAAVLLVVRLPAQFLS